MGEHKMVWTGVCDSCGAVHAMWPSEEMTSQEQAAVSREWPQSIDCARSECDGVVEWNGNDLMRDVLAPRML